MDRRDILTSGGEDTRGFFVILAACAASCTVCGAAAADPLAVSSSSPANGAMFTTLEGPIWFQFTSPTPHLSNAHVKVATQNSLDQYGELADAYKVDFVRMTGSSTSPGTFDGRSNFAPQPGEPWFFKVGTYYWQIGATYTEVTGALLHPREELGPVFALTIAPPPSSLPHQLEPIPQQREPIAFTQPAPPICHGCAPPTVICGQTVMSSPGPAIATSSFTRPGLYELSRGLRLSGRPRILRFVPSCQAGVKVAFEPRGALKLVSEARTKDGKLAAVVVLARRVGVARVVVIRPKGLKTVIVVHVSR